MEGMKIFPADQLGYIDTIQAFFLEMTGRGAMLSSRDLQLILEWRSRGASTAVICKGVEQAMREQRDLPRDIWGCRYSVEKLVGPAATEAPAPKVPTPAEDVLTAAMKRIEEAGKEADRETFKAAYRKAWRRLKELDTEDSFEAVFQVEESLLEHYWAALAASERQEITDMIAEEMTRFGQMSQSAKQQHEVARRRRLLQRDFGLIPLLEN